MAAALSLNAGVYARVSPAGAWYAVSSTEDGADRRLLQHLLQQPACQLDEARLQAWCACPEPDQALVVLHRLQRLGFVDGSLAPATVVPGTLEARLPALLAALSAEGRALLADDNGLYLACSGFLHEAAEQIAALAAEVLQLVQRHRRLLQHNLGLGTQAWALSDPAGQAELGFHPLFIGRQTFVLVIGGQPRLGDSALVALTEALCRRYA